MVIGVTLIAVLGTRATKASTQRLYECRGGDGAAYDLTFFVVGGGRVQTGQPACS